MLTIRTVTRDFSDLHLIEKLNEEAFPADERVGISVMLSVCEKGSMELLAFYDGDIFVGFASLARIEGLIYICFFAVDGTLRSRGYGTLILEALSEYKGKNNLVLEIEPVEKCAENYKQRVTRERFYLRNGFQKSGYRLQYMGLTFDVYHRGKSFDISDYIGILEGMRSGPFQPVITKIQDFAK